VRGGTVTRATQTEGGSPGSPRVCCPHHWQNSQSTTTSSAHIQGSGSTWVHVREGWGTLCMRGGTPQNRRSQRNCSDYLCCCLFACWLARCHLHSMYLYMRHRPRPLGQVADWYRTGGGLDEPCGPQGAGVSGASGPHPWRWTRDGTGSLRQVGVVGPLHFLPCAGIADG
jgi:hypothetical protein